MATLVSLKQQTQQPHQHRHLNSMQQNQLTRSLERILEDAHLSGELKLSGRKLKDFPKVAGKYNLNDTVIAGKLPFCCCLCAPFQNYRFQETHLVFFVNKYIVSSLRFFFLVLVFFSLCIHIDAYIPTYNQKLWKKIDHKQFLCTLYTHFLTYVKKN